MASSLLNRPAKEAVMRILYGIVGEGMGHATRSRVVIEHLLASGHDVQIVTSGPAVRALGAAFPGVEVLAIEGLHLAYQDNGLELGRTVATNVRALPAAVRASGDAYRRVRLFGPEAILSDFESWSAAYGLYHRIPVLSIDNIQIVHRASHAPWVTDGLEGPFRLAKSAAKVKTPGAAHYLVTSFFEAPLRKERTTIVPPILRRDIVRTRRIPGEHVVVYLRAADPAGLIELLREVPASFRIYGCGKPGRYGDVWVRDFSEPDFIDDLRSARAVIAAGGFSLMSEAVHLGVPMLSIPIAGQFEQEMNARYLERLGYGVRASGVSVEGIRAFLARRRELEHALATYPRQDNSRLFACVDELLARVEAGERRMARVAA
jgi:uncharacterized protein (TIGR00661 family)